MTDLFGYENLATEWGKWLRNGLSDCGKQRRRAVSFSSLPKAKGLIVGFGVTSKILVGPPHFRSDAKAGYYRVQTFFVDWVLRPSIGQTVVVASGLRRTQSKVPGLQGI